MAKGPWGEFTRFEIEPAEVVEDEVLRESQLACEQCAAVLAYEPGSDQLVCDYCGHANAILQIPIEIIEHDLNLALQKAQSTRLEEDSETVECTSCHASFTFDENIHAGDCPFCGQSIVTNTSSHLQIKPAAILPFAIAETQARGRVQKWLKGLWFAPNKLKRLGQVSGTLHGMYLPYWTYDSDTNTSYHGQRGDIYHVRRTVTINGKRQTRLVQKVRWSSAHGRVQRHFDDVLILASHSLPNWMTDRLEPWNLGALKPYTALYITGFQAESYQVELDDGFEKAHEKMKNRIAGDVRMHIGGDLQRIQSMDINHQDTTFKHILLPLWLGAFRYGGKSYHICVNGQSGEVQGERPYSVWKILAATAFIAVIAAGIAFLYLENVPVQ